MAAVEWLPSEEGTHAVVMGDLVTLCGEMVDLRSVVPTPASEPCAKCAEITADLSGAIGGRSSNA